MILFDNSNQKEPIAPTQSTSEPAIAPEPCLKKLRSPEAEAEPEPQPEPEPEPEPAVEEVYT